MKYPFALFIFLAMVNLDAFAQKQKSMISVAKITTMNNASVTGILYSVTDSSVSLYTENKSIDKPHLELDSLPLKIYTYHDIQKMKVRRRSAIAKGTAIGGVTGLAIGLIVDAADQSLNSIVIYGTGPSEPAPFTPTFTITFTLIGAGIGAAIGSSSKIFEIDGKEESFKASEYQLVKHSFSK